MIIIAYIVQRKHYTFFMIKVLTYARIQCQTKYYVGIHVQYEYQTRNLVKQKGLRY